MQHKPDQSRTALNLSKLHSLDGVKRIAGHKPSSSCPRRTCCGERQKFTTNHAAKQRSGIQASA